MMRCWCGYLSAARCRLFAYGPPDATAIPKPPNLLSHFNPDWFYLSGTGLPRLSWKSGVYTGVVVVIIVCWLCCCWCRLFIRKAKICAYCLLDGVVLAIEASTKRLPFQPSLELGTSFARSSVPSRATIGSNCHRNRTLVYFECVAVLSVL